MGIAGCGEHVQVNEDIALLGHVDTQCDHALLRGTRWRI